MVLQHAWPRRPPWCRLCEPGGTKSLMRHSYLNKQHAPHVPSWPSPSTQPSSPPARLRLPVGWVEICDNRCDLVPKSTQFWSAIILKCLVLIMVLQHAWPWRPPRCRLCEPGGTKTLMRHPYLNKQHAPHVPSGPSPLATATSMVQIVRAWRHEKAYAPPLLE